LERQFRHDEPPTADENSLSTRDDGDLKRLEAIISTAARAGAPDRTA